MATGKGLPQFFDGLWKDRTRFLAAGGIAILLWFLLGEKVTNRLPIPLDVTVLAAGEAPVGSGLFIRLPESLAFSAVDPASVTVSLEGPRADLAAVRPLLQGFYDVPLDFLAGKQSESNPVNIDGDLFPQLDSLRLEVVHATPLVLSVAKRDAGRISLGAGNIEFDPPTLAENMDVVFEPSSLSVTGPQAPIQRLREDPSLFKLATIARSDLAQGERGELSFRAAQGSFEEEALARLRFVDGGGSDVIKVRLKRRREMVIVSLTDVEVVPFVPSSAKRDNIRMENPLTLEPATIDVKVTLPKEGYADKDEAKAAVGRALNLFVDLGDMAFTELAGRLPIRIEGLPDGATIEFSVDVIDVTWNEIDTVEEPE